MHASVVSGRTLCALLLATQWQRPFAWSTEGHERIARVALSLIKGRQRDHVSAILHGDLVQLAAWERNMTAQHPTTAALHWHRQDPEWGCNHARRESSHLGDKEGHIKCDGHGAESGSLFCALAFFFDQFAHKALLKEFPPPKEPIGTPSALMALADFKAKDLKKSSYLRWLVTLLGDLHQPLHWLRLHDYGRTIQVAFRGETYTLLQFWEDFLPKNLPPMPEEDKLLRDYENKRPGWWDTLPPELFRTWARDTAETLCTQVYGEMEVNHADGTRRIDSPFKLDEELFTRWAKLANGFTVQAGQHIAYVLQDILEHKKHKAFTVDGRGRHHRRKRPMQNFLSNLLLGGITVPSLLFAFRWHERAGSPSLRDMLGLARTHLKL